MPRATLTLTIPEAIWMGELSRTYPETRLRVLSAVKNDEGGVALVELTSPHEEAVISAAREYDSVAAVEVLNDEAEGLLLQLETTMPLLLEPLQRSGVPLEMPFNVQDGEVVWEVTTSRERLSMLGDQLESLGISFTVESIYQQVESEQLLTDHQWDVLSAAVECGYYDTPRSCTQEELADELGIAKSTCSETLHRAEEQIIKRFLSNHEDKSSVTPTP